MTTLDLSGCELGDAGLAPIVDALPQARHLRTLNIIGNGLSGVFASERLEPAVRACVSLLVHWVPPADDDDDDEDDDEDEDEVDEEDVDGEDFDGEDDMDDDEM